MRLFVSILGLSLVFAMTVRAQEAPKPTTPQKEHEWLKQFVGEWETESEASLGPGQPLVKCKGTMKSRMLGGLWVITDTDADMHGTRIQAVQVIGYDPSTKSYIGTWVDSMMGHMWKYQGSVDEKGTTLNLDAEGPDFETPGKTAKYRDSYEFKSKDHIVLTSSMQGPDGKWIPFMSSQVRRSGPSAEKQ